MALVDFLESPRFPDDIALKSTRDLEFASIRNDTDSGGDEVDIRWDLGRREWNVGSGLRKEADIYDIDLFFLLCRGPGVPFRFKDWFDYNSNKPGLPISAADQLIGVGDGETTTFRVVKNYSLGGLTMVRPLSKLVADTTLIALAGVPTLSGWTVNNNTAEVTFEEPPALNVDVTAGYEFDVPVCFISNRQQVSLELIAANQIPRIMIREIKL